jgi:hypothetical protein
MNALPSWQVITVLAVPTFAVLLGILLNQKSIDRLEGRMDKLSDRMESLSDRLDRRMERIEEEQRSFRKQMHDEYIGLLGLISDHGQRIVRLEQRS